MLQNLFGLPLNGLLSNTNAVQPASQSVGEVSAGANISIDKPLFYKDIIKVFDAGANAQRVIPAALTDISASLQLEPAELLKGLQTIAKHLSEGSHFPGDGNGLPAQSSALPAIAHVLNQLTAHIEQALYNASALNLSAVDQAPAPLATTTGSAPGLNIEVPDDVSLLAVAGMLEQLRTELGAVQLPPSINNLVSDVHKLLGQIFSPQQIAYSAEVVADNIAYHGVATVQGLPLTGAPVAKPEMNPVALLSLPADAPVRVASTVAQGILQKLSGLSSTAEHPRVTAGLQLAAESVPALTATSQSAISVVGESRANDIAGKLAQLVSVDPATYQQRPVTITPPVSAKAVVLDSLPSVVDLQPGEWGQAVRSFAGAGENPVARVAAVSNTPPGQGFATRVGLPVASEQWGGQFVQRVNWLVGQSMSFAEIQINPPELGPIQLRVDQSENAARVAITVHNASTRDAVETQLPRLRDLFASQGLDLQDVDVESQQFADKETYSDGYQQSEQPDQVTGDIDTSDSVVEAEAANAKVAATQTLVLRYGTIDAFA